MAWNKPLLEVTYGEPQILGGVDDGLPGADYDDYIAVPVYINQQLGGTSYLRASVPWHDKTKIQYAGLLLPQTLDAEGNVDQDWRLFVNNDLEKQGLYMTTNEMLQNSIGGSVSTDRIYLYGAYESIFDARITISKSSRQWPYWRVYDNVGEILPEVDGKFVLFYHIFKPVGTQTGTLGWTGVMASPAERILNVTGVDDAFNSPVWAEFGVTGTARRIFANTIEVDDTEDNESENTFEADIIHNPDTALYHIHAGFDTANATIPDYVGDGFVIESSPDAPYITLVGSYFLPVHVGESLSDIDPGAIAYDPQQGDISDQISMLNYTALESDIEFLFTTAYNVTDEDGNQALQATREYQIRPNTIRYLRIPAEYSLDTQYDNSNLWIKKITPDSSLTWSRYADFDAWFAGTGNDYSDYDLAAIRRWMSPAYESSSYQESSLAYRGILKDDGSHWFPVDLSNSVSLKIVLATASELPVAESLSIIDFEGNVIEEFNLGDLTYSADNEQWFAHAEFDFGRVFVVDGYFPVFETEEAALESDYGNGTSTHTHVLSDGITYFMPDGISGGPGGGIQFHGDAGPINPLTGPADGTLAGVEGIFPLYRSEAAAAAANFGYPPEEFVISGISYWMPGGLSNEEKWVLNNYGLIVTNLLMTLTQTDSYGDGWNGVEFNVYTHEGGTLLSTSTLESGAAGTDVVELPAGTYFWALENGNWEEETGFVLTLDSDGSTLVSGGGAYETGTFTISAPADAGGGDEGAGDPPPVDGGSGDSGEFDWTFDGQLSDIVKVVKGQDASGTMSMMYLKDNAGSTDVYITPTVTDFSQFTLMSYAETGMTGTPVSGEYAHSGCFVVGTTEGNVYKIQVNTYGSPSSAELLHAFGEGSVSSVSYSSGSQEWLMEHGGKVYTMPYYGGAVEMKVELPSGAKVVDFAVGPDGVAMTLQMTDFSLAAYIAGPDWSEINDPSTMSAVLTAIGPSDFNYFVDVDMWIAASSDGSFVTTSDINNWLE